MYIYIYICMFTFIHSLHNFAWFTFICYITILHKNKQTYFSQILQIKSVKVSKKSQSTKISRRRNIIFSLMLWDSVVKFKYFPPNIHHFCFSIAAHVMLPSKFNFSSARSKNLHVFFDANISCKLIFWRSIKSFQQINSLLRLKSCKIITSALSASTHAHLSFAGLLNALQMISSGFNMKVLQQFA